MFRFQIHFANEGRALLLYFSEVLLEQRSGSFRLTFGNGLFVLNFVAALRQFLSPSTKVSLHAKTKNRWNALKTI